jgi:energy-coupling factor transporter ATP-binding protein EcfA2
MEERMTVTFEKAIKREAKGRVALIGPAGSGKSYTMLTLARLLAGPSGKIAAIDTEHGSLSKYADLFDFDVIELASFTADNFLDALEAASAAGYSVFCCDSLSHFWMGKDGALEFVDERKKRARDQMEGWKDWRPQERAMIDGILAAPMHVLVTMRTKNEYRDEEYVVDGKKKTKRIKVGLAPVQRDGMEYEFDLVALMDDDNNFIVDKSRCSALSGKLIGKPKEKDFLPFADWLSGAPAKPKAEVRPAESTVAAKSAAKAEPPAVPPSPFQAMIAKFSEAKAAIGSDHYYRILAEHGFKHANEIKDPNVTGVLLVKEMRDIAKAEKRFLASNDDLPVELQEASSGQA